MSSRAATRTSAPLIRIHTLGRFTIEAEGRPLATGGKGPGKPLALLKVLIALGGEAVHATTLSESLWPDAEGDHAYSAFTTTLRRLRTLIGHDALRLEGGRLSLVPRLCWVDTMEFAAAQEQARRALNGGDAQAAWRHSSEAMALYHGPFLPGEFEPVELLAARERLHGQYLQHVGSLSDHLVAAGDPERALALCRRALEVDEVAEELYRRIMSICLGLGRIAEGLAAYDRVRGLLLATAGVAPSAETEALRRALRDAPPSQRLHAAPPGLAVRPPAVGTSRLAPDTPALHPTLAVQPFTALGGDPEQVVFGHGLSEDLAAGLAHLVRLRIVRLPPLGPDADALAQAREAGATHLLVGTVRTSGDRVRVTANLSDVDSRRQLWADRYDRALSDLFGVQDEISDAIVTELDVQLLEGEQARVHKRGTNSVEAWGLCKQALVTFMDGTRDGNRHAERHFRQAMAADPSYPFTVRGVIYTLCQALDLGFRTATPHDLQELAHLLALAQELDPEGAANLLAKALMHNAAREHDLAVSFARKAMEALPEHADLVFGCSWCQLNAGQADEALRTYRSIRRPVAERGILYPLILSAIHFSLAQYAECSETVAGLAPNGSPMWIFPIGALVAERKLPEAERLATAYQAQVRNSSDVRSFLGAVPFRDQSVLEHLRQHLQVVGLS